VLNRIAWLLLAVFLLASPELTSAQSAHEFLGSPRLRPDDYTSLHEIRYNTQGYDKPKAKWNKKIAKWKDKGVPDSIIEQILAFPGSPDEIGKWIDDAFDQAQARFIACGGALETSARAIKGHDLYVTIMPSAFYEPFYKINVAGAFYPDTMEIKVLNIYYTWSGENKGWLRHARDLLVYEMENYFAFKSGIQPEPRGEGWPCSAPPLKQQ
jgi:hypothetical protein